MNVKMSSLFSKKGYQILKSNYNKFLRCGGRASAKTYETVCLLIITLLKNPTKDAMVIRKTNASLDKSVCEAIRKALKMFGLEYLFIENKTEHTFTNRQTGQVIYCTGCEEEYIKAKESRNGLCFIWVEEVQQLKNEKELRDALSTALRFADEETKIILTGNSRPERTHWINVFKEKQKTTGEFELVDTTYLDILDKLPKPIIDEINNLKEFEPELYNTIYLGKLGASHTAIYNKFDYDKDVVDNLDVDNPNDYYFFVGVDYGDADATTFCLTAISKQLNEVLVLDLYYHKNNISKGQKDINDYKEDLFLFLKKAYDKYNQSLYVNIDSAALAFYKIVKKEQAIKRFTFCNIHKTNKKKVINKNGGIESRILLTKLLLGANALKINSDCKELIEVLELAEYDSNGKRKDDGTFNIDILDSFEYSFLKLIDKIYNRILRGKQNVKEKRNNEIV